MNFDDAHPPGHPKSQTTAREIRFALLAPGNYLLQVQAQDSEGLWRSQTAEFAFTVLTPWYRSWWFVCLCVLIPIAFLLGIVRVRVVRLQREKREFERLKSAQDEIRTLAFYDSLTALPNRRLLVDRMERAIVASEQTGRLCGLLFIDLDNFKMLNDSLGHETGDLLLKKVADRLSNLVREQGTVARLGGDEFVVVLEDLSGEAEKAAQYAEGLAEKILVTVGRSFSLGIHDWQITCSIGITIFGRGHDSPDEAPHEEALKQADIAMYHAKSAGRNQVRFFAPELQAAINARAALEIELRQALENGEFFLHFQPQILNNRVHGAEALIRWRHPERGLLMPGAFIPLAEETGLILGLGDWVLNAACMQLARWSQYERTRSLRLAVNISAKQFRQPDFVERVLSALAKSGADPALLKLELTESMLVECLDDVVEKMQELHRHGLRLSLDDFGTGYSSLAYLKRLPLDELKIDRSFVSDMLKNPRGRVVVETIIHLSSGLGIEVMAEGVETKEQQGSLSMLGCEAYQGYLFGRPAPIEEFNAQLMLETANSSKNQVGFSSKQASELRLVG